MWQSVDTLRSFISAIPTRARALAPNAHSPHRTPPHLPKGHKAMHCLGRTGEDGEGADWGRVTLSVRLATLALSALANGGIWMDNGAAL